MSGSGIASVEPRRHQVATHRAKQAQKKSMEEMMSTWNAPKVTELEVGLEVTGYLPAEIDTI